MVTCYVHIFDKAGKHGPAGEILRDVAAGGLVGPGKTGSHKKGVVMSKIKKSIATKTLKHKNPLCLCVLVAKIDGRIPWL